MTVPASSTVIAEQATEQDFTWKGSDEFSDLGDRKDLPPEPLPALTSPKRVVLVRHGQSTWNAEGRIQGSTDFAVLTQKGQAQADTTRGTVSDQPLLLLASHTTPHLPFMFSRCSGMSFHNKVEDVLQLLDDNFDMLVHSPLARAKETAEIIWGNRKGKVHVLPSLREVDLYSFQVGHLAALHNVNPNRTCVLLSRASFITCTEQAFDVARRSSIHDCQ